jgi:exonuclease SbcD
VRFLHTADWHVGKVLKGHDRLPEHRAVLAEIVSLAAAEEVDAVIVAGDLFESAVPHPEAQALVWRTLIELRATGAEVIVVAGNHDNAAVFDALSPLFAGLGVTVAGRVRRPAEGGVVRFRARSTGEPVEVALLPYQSQRGIVTSQHLMDATSGAARHAQVYADRMAQVISALTVGLSAEAVRIVAAHAHVRGGLLGGGEREAQTIFDYGIDAVSFGSAPHYVALGHLHRPQSIPGGCPIHYSGSPVQVDFGEVGDATSVNVVEATPTTRAKVSARTITSARRLRTVEGTLDELLARAGEFGEDLLRIRVRGTPRTADLAERVRAAHPHALEVRVEAPVAVAADRPVTDHRRSPHELFAGYLAASGIADGRLTALFAELLHDDAAAGAELLAGGALGAGG